MQYQAEDGSYNMVPYFLDFISMTLFSLGHFIFGFQYYASAKEILSCIERRNMFKHKKKALWASSFICLFSFITSAVAVYIKFLYSGNAPNNIVNLAMGLVWALTGSLLVLIGLH